ncbi:MAG: hypothetical protein RIQ87_368 [Chloroflexota bacterium]|jgi:hypothetical protein
MSKHDEATLPLPWPPVIAEARSPFTAVRVAALMLARKRGLRERLADIADALNAAHLDWLFERRVVIDELLQLQANWFSDFRTTTGFIVEDSDQGPVVTLEDSSRMSGWLERQVAKATEECKRELAAFAKSDRAAGDR